MVQRRQRFRFALEAREPLGITRDEVGQSLEGDIAIESRIVRAIDLAHAARAERCEESRMGRGECRT